MALGNLMVSSPAKQPGRRAGIFIDKDGTLIDDVPYNIDPEQICLTGGAGRALRRMKVAGYKLIVISNQSGIARGLFEEQDLVPVNERIQALLAPYGVEIDDFYYCPHGPSDHCECRKPMPGMISRAASAHTIDVQGSWMIGDILNDVEAGNRAGCKTIHLNRGNETEWRKGDYRQPLYTVEGWDDAADIVCASPDRA